jgi:hypothetical protein
LSSASDQNLSADGEAILKRLKNDGKRKHLVAALARAMWDEEKEQIQKDRDRRIRR